MRHSEPSLRNFCNLGSVLLVLLAAHRPTRVEACSYFPTWDGFAGYPGAGAENVPIDAVPIYRNPLQDFPAVGSVSFALESDDGASVALQARAVESETQARWTELMPAAPLRPNTRYTLRAHVEYNPDRYTLPASDSSLDFTTGSTSGSATPPEPAIEVQHFLPVSSDSCSGGVWPSTCLALPDESWYEVDGLASRMLVHGPSFVTLLGGTASCVTLRQRAPNASLGPAHTVCRGEGPLFHKQDFDNRAERVQCSAAGMTLNGAPIGETLSPVPLAQWMDLLRKPGAPEAGVADASDAGGDAGSPAGSQDAQGAGSESATSGADLGRDVMQGEEANEAGCSVSSRQPRVADLTLAVLVLASMLRRRRRAGALPRKQTRQ